MKQTFDTGPLRNVGVLLHVLWGWRPGPGLTRKGKYVNMWT